MTRRISAVIVTVLAALALVAGACSKGPDLTGARAKAFELLGEYGPKVSGLIGKQAELARRLAALPPGTDGAGELGPKLDAQQVAIGQLEVALDGYAVAIERAGKTGGQQGIEAAMTAFAGTMNDGIGKITGALDAAAQQLATMEEKAKAAAAAPPVVDVTIGLPDGHEVEGAPGGAEQQLVAWLGDKAKPVAAAEDEAAWLTLERVKFAPDQPAPGGPLGDDQVKAIAAILRAFPHAKLAIGGHAGAGEAKADALAKARGEAVMRALIAAGADEKRLRAEGRGTTHPLCTATGATDDETCKAMNRRVALRVTAK